MSKIILQRIPEFKYACVYKVEKLSGSVTLFLQKKKTYATLRME